MTHSDALDLLTPDGYRQLQIARSLVRRDYDPAPRARPLLRVLARFVAPGPDIRVLCVGARNRHELACVEAAGYDPIGIDLHSTDPRIVIMDMHQLAFATGAFDVVYASHSFEHALDPVVAAAEFIRVVENHGVILLEVPVRTGPRGADLWDYESADDVASLFRGCDVLWTETGPQVAAPQDVARLVLRTRQ
jgi:SAM-dependent methyltransferase